MSAIIAGDKCRECGEKYWVSLGHPKWHDDVVKRGLPMSKEYRRFKEMASSGMCPGCYIKTEEEKKK